MRVPDGLSALLRQLRAGLDGHAGSSREAQHRRRRIRERNTIRGFGYEWTRFDQSGDSSASELDRIFSLYFLDFPWASLPPGARGFDLGCGSGRWASRVATRVATVACVDASAEALRITRRNAPGCPLVQARAKELPFAPQSMDFGYSLGVLHHTEDPRSGLADAVAALKPGAPFLVYLYYALDDRPLWFRAIWRTSDAARRVVSKCPLAIRYAASQAVALLLYLPLSRWAALLERRGRNVDHLPLAAYRNRSLYQMRTDALDRVGTGIETRYTKEEVDALMRSAGLFGVTVRDDPPYWCAIGFRAPASSS